MLVSVKLMLCLSKGCLTFFRGLVMMTFSPILMRIGYGLSWQNAVVTAWGGLRGAVGLALALQVYIDHPEIGGKVCFSYMF